MQGKYCNLHFDASIRMKSEVPKEGDQYDPFKIKYDPMNFCAISLELNCAHVKPRS